MSALARYLADRVEAAPTQRIEVEALYTAAVTFDRSLATAPTARGDIRDALHELVAAELVVLPSSSRHFDVRAVPALPLWVRRPPRERIVRETRGARVWPVALEAAGRIAGRDDEVALLETVAAFLRDGGTSRPRVPMRERSLELFGDEKRLNKLLATRLFRSGALTPDLLRCYSVPIPFVSQWISGAVDTRGTALLIAENHHTYASLLEVTRHYAAEGGPGRHVGYGTGNQFPSAVLSVPLLVPAPARIVYFGDVDLKGLQIPAAANAGARAAGLPEVVPAYPLYELLFGARHRSPAARVPAAVAVEAAEWLGQYAERARDALIDGFRLPQEAVGYELLMDHRDVLDAI
ncbi:Wadjet anti-phage system protein JetD domain-containing protein [Amycolatopsis sp. NBC_01286]|uniref:Wadjet anti-phage system protein JetD domain-containing protein n=1 Tax=Amycolatopsis sp. NBC_01286 TaxID=2903560 RepID=UPI002E147396|nr:DUF2220 family protein [Amycolatopsis sp. NBC_01286]